MNGWSTILLWVALMALGCAGRLPEAVVGPRSADLTRDLRLMWETRRLENSSAWASTDAAVAASRRVFDSVCLVGLTRAEVVARLGDPRGSSRSQYNFPFWGAPKGALVYRFDCGSYGWQFNVVFDGRGMVKRVETLGID